MGEPMITVHYYSHNGEPIEISFEYWYKAQSFMDSIAFSRIIKVVHADGSVTQYEDKK